MTLLPSAFSASAFSTSTFSLPRFRFHVLERLFHERQRRHWPVPAHPLIQAAGATAVAYSLIGATAGTASAADDRPEAADRLVIHPVPGALPINTTYVVKARTPGGQWKPVPVLRATTKTINEKTGSGTIRPTSVAGLDFTGTVEVQVTWSKGTIPSARIRPPSYDIQHEVSGDTITFGLTEPRNLSIEIDGDIYGNLQLHANPIEKTQPEKDDPDVIYFGPGLHTPSGGVVKVPSGKTVYLAGGAVLNARVEFVKVENARLLGRGIIWNSDAATLVAFSKNIPVVHDKMRKPGWYLTTDMVPAFANEHVKNLRFLDADTAASTDTPEITSAGTATAVKQQVFNYLTTASALPTSFSAEELPKGLTIDEKTGLISGIPQVPGTYTVTVKATNTAGTANQSVTLTVQNA